MSKEEIQKLNQRIAQLSLLCTLRSQEKESLEQKYNERLAELNGYIDSLHKLLNISTEDGAIEDIDFINTLKDTDTESYILIPKKHIEAHKLKVPTQVPNKAQDNIKKSTKQNESSTGPEKIVSNSTGRKKKMSCSYCNEQGHKRAQCPKILFPSV